MTRMRRRRFLERLLAAGSVAVPAIAVGNVFQAGYGDLTGRLVYDGEPPERAKLKVDKDVDCCGKYDIRDESLMVAEDGGLANVFIYARSRGMPIEPEREAEMSNEVVLDNRDCIFKPHCMAIWYTKQSLHIVNSDPIAQNVAFAPLGDLPANIVLSPAPGEKTEATWRFRRAQTSPVHIVCNYHPWESAYILVRDTPYFAISEADGRFTIPKLPLGTWEFQVWHERTTYLETSAWPRGRFSIEIKPGVNDLGEITLPASLFARR